MTETERFRLFVAVEIPAEIKTRLAEVQGELRRILSDRGVRWARREQFHLTLRFLGDVEVARVAALEEALRGACRGIGALHLGAARLGFFPDARRPRVVWIGVDDGGGRLARLQQAVEAAAAGFTTEETDGEYSGHVTLARIKHVGRLEAKALAHAAAGMVERRFGEWTVREIALMRSELLPEGARHLRLRVFELGGGG